MPPPAPPPLTRCGLISARALARRRRRVPHGVHQSASKKTFDFVQDGARDGWVEEVVVDPDPGRTDIAQSAPARHVAQRRHCRFTMTVGGRVGRRVLIQQRRKPRRVAHDGPEQDRDLRNTAVARAEGPPPHSAFHAVEARALEQARVPGAAAVRRGVFRHPTDAPATARASTPSARPRNEAVDPTTKTLHTSPREQVPPVRGVGLEEPQPVPARQGHVVLDAPGILVVLAPQRVRVGELLVVRLLQARLARELVHHELDVRVARLEFLEAELYGRRVLVKLRAARRESVRVVQDRQIVVLRVVERCVERLIDPYRERIIDMRAKQHDRFEEPGSRAHELRHLVAAVTGVPRGGGEEQPT